MISPVIKFVTYNVGGRDPPEDTSFIKGLLNLEESNPDIISFGTEEQPANLAEKVHDIVDEQAGNKTGDKKGSWGEVMDEALSPYGYYLIAKNSIYYTHLRVYAKKQHMGYIDHVETIDVASGFVGGVSNVWKGAITTRFVFYGTSMAFINAHLSAHQEQILNRNTEFWDNMTGQEFNDPTTPYIYDHDYIFWTGDLNYRINAENKHVREVSLSGDISSLIPHDQLLTQQRRGLAFLGFEEATINFIPTYKFNFDTNEFDTVKNRIPAWCDRVLVRVKEHRQIAAGLIKWGDLELSDESSLSFSSDDINTMGDDKSKKKKKKRKHKGPRKGKCTDHIPDDERISKMRRKTIGLLLRTNKGCSLKTTPQQSTIELDKSVFTDQGVFEDFIRGVESKTRDIISQNNEYQTVDIVEYRGHPTLLFSDHKPVSCTMKLRLKDHPVKPTLRFEFDEYTWPKNEKLLVHIKDGKSLKKGRFKVLKSNWVDYYDDKVGSDKHTVLYYKKLKHLNPCKITGGQVLSIEVPAGVHPGPGHEVSVVFVTGHNEYMATAQVKCT